MTTGNGRTITKMRDAGCSPKRDNSADAAECRMQLAEQARMFAL